MNMKQIFTMALGLLMAVAMQAQVTFTAADWAQAQSLSDGATVTSYTSGNVTVSFAQGTSSNAVVWNATSSYISTASGNTMTISTVEGKVITSASFTTTVASHATRLANSTWDSGSAEASGTTATWTGSAQSVTVTLTNSVRLTAFAITIEDAPEPEEPEDESLYNDTTVVTAAEWITAEDVASGDRVDAMSYQKEGKTLNANKNTGSQISINENELRFYAGNTLAISAPYMMHKIVLKFINAEAATDFLEGNDQRGRKTPVPSTCSVGSFRADATDDTQVLWLGSSAGVTITFGYSISLRTLTIISDNTVTGATVTFLGLNGEELKSETVAFGGSATAPALPTTDEVGYSIRWDKDFSNVQGDLTVRAVKVPTMYLDLTPAECDAIKVENTKNNYISFTSGGATITLSGDRATEATNWASREGKVVIFAGNTIAVSATETFRTVRFTCLDADDAQRVAGSTCTSGTFTASGNIATWKGAATSLTLTTTSWDYEVGVTRFEVLSSVAPTLVTFLDKDGNVLKVDTVPMGGNATAPEVPAVTGYVFSGWSVPFTNVTEDITTQAQYSLDPNYVIVTFTDLMGNVIETQLVTKGSDVTAPAAPSVPSHVFTGWSAPLTNIQSTQTIRAQYTFVYDPNDPNIMTVTEWATLLQQSDVEREKWEEGEEGLRRGEAYAVKGVFYETTALGLENDGRYSFILTEDGQDHGDTRLVACHMYGPNNTPFYSTTQLSQGDTAIVYGTFGQKGIVIPYQGGELYTGLIDGYVPYIGKVNGDGNAIYIDLPRAEALYDFSGNGLKQAPIVEEKTTQEWIQGGYLQYTTNITLQLTADATGNFQPQELYGKVSYVYKGEEPGLGDANVAFVEDINGDGKADLSSFGAGTFVKTVDGCERIDGLAVTNMDINCDGRIDYLILDQSLTMSNRATAYYGAVAYQLPDGSFQEERMQVFTWDEFVAQMTSEELDQYQNPQNYSLGEVSRYTYPTMLGGAALSRAPRRDPSDPKKAPGSGSSVSAPTKAIDLNGDGLVDLIDEKNGIIYTNMDNGKWVWTTTNGAIIPADLNNDGVTDFVFPGAKLYTVIYDKATKTFNQTILYQNATSDNIVHCYDFDQDGDVDILATFSAENNATGYAYTCFFTNNGQGVFTQQPEQNYGPNALVFVAMQDLDGDGYYDLLAYNPTSNNKYNLVWIKGQSGLRFNTTPQVLATDAITRETYWDSSKQPFTAYPVNAEDLNGDGKLEIWVSGTNYGSTKLYSIENAVANQAPSAPAAPQLAYNNGLLTITWGNGSDVKTATADLTYALRIGTTAGGNDILAAHANADGSRRNFIDGNMGKEHSYTIDLRTYTPATVYVAVQAIDAQHSGSAWSQEATAAHTYLPVEFTLDRSSININETVELTFTALPEGYTHAWTVQDGSYESPESATKLILFFTSGGEKTITHTVTTPNGGTLTASATIQVMPAGVGEALTINNDEREYIFDAPVADYNFDGRMDGIKRSSYSSGTYASMVVMEGVTTDQLFTQAAGLWNTNILSSSVQSDGASYIRWYDYNRDGMLDLLFREGNSWSPSYGILYHDATQPTLTARQDDDNLLYLFEYNQSGMNAEDNYSGNSFYSDMTHNGLYDNLMMNPSNHYQLIEIDGNGGNEWKQFTVNGDAELFQSILGQVGSNGLLADFDHDGYTDIAAYHRNDNGTYNNRLDLFYNRGNAHFEQAAIPFSQGQEENSYGYIMRLADLNGDSYLDLIVRPTSMSAVEQDYLAVLWNNANQSFSAPHKMPNSEALSDSYETLSNLADLDNNGYPDLVAAVKNPAAGNDHKGIYVWYMGAEGLLSHGFILPDVSEYGASVQPVDVAAGDRRLLVNGTQLYPIVAQADERPAAPTGLQAKMTEEGLLITWNAAVDDHTPANLMRYNLAVKQQGAATWLISPQNGLNTTAAYLPDYDYIEATQFLIPTTYLRAGNYEIAIQALDRQNQLSLFTEAVVANVTRSPIEAPASACADKNVTVSYRGAETTGMPEWNWDGATVVEGSGFGPYTVYWPFDHQSGDKTITLTLNGETYTRTIAISDPSALNVVLPTVLYEGTAAAATVPEGVTYTWYALIDDYGEAYPVTASGVQLPSTAPSGGSAVLRLDYRLTANGLNVTAVRKAGNIGSLVGHEVTLYLEVTNANGCSVRFSQPVTVMPSTDIPVITLVTTDATGHNVVSWTNADAFASVNVYKEGSSLNEFQLIGSAAASAGTYTDNSSDASQKAERYRLTGVTADGNESPESTIHKTVHLTISRGVMDGTYNLIWNEYAGANVASYNILRGASPASLTSIATVAASNTSYTDQTPDDNLPYYAIEYILPAAANVPAVNPNRAPAANLAGRSNVVDRRSAEQGLENVQSGNVQYTKVLIDGTIFILRGEKVYTLTGQETIVP